MTPKIVTRLANIAAKLAGSDKYDPTIEPKTAFEYYLDKGVDKILAIKGVPAVEAGDKGKVLSVSDSGAPAWEDKGPVVVTFSGTTEGGDASCNKLYAELAAVPPERLVIRYRGTGGFYYYLNLSIDNTSIGGWFTWISDPDDPNGSSITINARRFNNNSLNVHIIDNL